MTMSLTSASRSTSTPFQRLWADAPVFTGLALLLALASLPLFSAMSLDARLFQGDSIWLKPLKFHAALSIYLITLAYCARFLPATMRASRGWRIYVGVVATAIIAEVAWIGGAAALGTASHFNISSPLWTALYALMGASAVTLTSASLVMGLSIWRNPATGLTPAVQLSVALGLVLTFVLTLVVAGTMSSGTGHFVGVPTTGAILPILGWSREVGDLRAPHFFATHALHGVPAVGLLASRLLPDASARIVVWAAGLGYAGLVMAMFVQALMGLPLI